MTALALLTGVGAGAGAVAFRYMILGFTYLFTGHRDYSAVGPRRNPLAPGSGSGSLSLAPVVGGLIYGPAGRRLRAARRAVTACPR